MGDGNFLLEFGSRGEATMVLQKGERAITSFSLELCRWLPNEECLSNSGFLKELWVRLVGLPAHLWELKVMEKMGDVCGGFLVVDRETRMVSDLQWARILV